MSGVLTEQRARSLALGVAAARLALGVFAFVAPERAARPWVGRGAGADRRVLCRALGARDIALGLGALVAAQRGAPLRGWVEAGGLSDAGDTLATLLSLGQLPPLGRIAVLAASGGAAAAAAVAAPSL